MLRLCCVSLGGKEEVLVVRKLDTGKKFYQEWCLPCCISCGHQIQLFHSVTRSLLFQSDLARILNVLLITRAEGGLCR